MFKAYTMVDFEQEDAISVSYNNTHATIALQEYSDEEYKEFSKALGMWELLLIDDSWKEEGIETGNYSSTDTGYPKRFPLNADNLLIKNNEVVGFVLGKNHYPNWKTSGNTVLMFLDGTSIGPVEYEYSYVWGDYPSDTTYYHDCYTYKLVKKAQ